MSGRVQLAAAPVLLRPPLRVYMNGDRAVRAARRVKGWKKPYNLTKLSAIRSTNG